MNSIERSQPSLKEKLPVAFFCFKRPDLTKSVFEAICAYQPEVLHVFLDAARPNVAGEKELVDEVKLLFEDKDHNFPIIHHYSGSNLGIQGSFHRGLQTMAAAHEKFIILEDDCFPNEDFFSFVSDCLHFFGSNGSVGMVQGLNLNPFSRFMGARAYLSSRMKIWGWATWKESVVGFDPSDKPWLSEDANRILKEAGWNLLERRRFLASLDAIDELGTWDYQWVYHLLRQKKYSVSPVGNFIVNLGFGEGSIHTVIPWPSARRSPKPDRPKNSLEDTRLRVDYIDQIEFYARSAVDATYAVLHIGQIANRLRTKMRSSKSGLE